MNRKRLKQLAKDPGLVPGVYNYCDRWCERCTLAARCLQYRMEEEQRAQEEAAGLAAAAGDEPDDAKLLAKVQESFELAMEMLEESCAEQGIDWEQVKADAKGAKPGRRKRERIPPIAGAAMDYARAISTWFEASQPLFRARGAELSRIASMDLPGHDPAADAAEVNDAMAVLRWYQAQIHVKLMRALTTAQEDDDLIDPEIAAYDANGSTKVALLGIDRSIDAWTRLRRHFPEAEGQILGFLIQLDGLRKKVEKRFPDARAFRRPGFDDGTGDAPARA